MIKKLLMGALLLWLVAYGFRADIAPLIMAKGLDRLLNSDVIGEQGDGLYVRLCGAGGPLADPKRSGPCVVVAAGGTFLVVDAGSGSARTLGRQQMRLGELHAVLLTHYHSDHIDGLGELALQRWVQGANQEAMPVYGPGDVSSVVTGFNRAYQQDAIYRQAHHGDAVAPLSGAGMHAVSFEMPAPGQLVRVLTRNGLQVDALLVEHDPVEPAVAYLIRYKGRSVLISGDTRRSSNLAHFAEGVDLLLHEALSPELVSIMQEAAERNGNAILAKVTADIPDYHASPVEAAEIARDAEVKHLLYYHVVPPLIVPGAEVVWLQGVEEVFSDYTLGQDGSGFFLPADSDALIELR